MTSATMLAMSTFVSPQIFLVSLLAGWLNQEQQKLLEYLQEENRVLKAQLGQRLRLSDEQRRRLAAKGCFRVVSENANGAARSNPRGVLKTRGD